MRALRMPELREDQLAELSKTYRNTKDVRIRTRVQMVLLAVEQHLTAPRIAIIVREMLRRCDVGSNAIVLKEEKDYEIGPDLERHPKPLRLTKSKLLRPFADGPIAWGSRTRCGPCKD